MNALSTFRVWLGCLAVSVIASTLLGCGSNDTMDSEDVNENRIHRNYRLSWDADSRELAATAQFRAGGASGTTVRLTAPSEVRFDDVPMNVVDGDRQVANLSGTWYRRSSYVDTTTGPYRIHWQRRDGRIFENVLELPQGFELVEPEANAQLTPGQPWRFVLGGASLAADVELSVSVESRAQGGSSSIVSGRAFGASTLVVSSGETQRIAPGRASVTVRLSQGRAIQNGTDDLGGRVEVESTLRRIDVEILPR